MNAANEAAVAAFLQDRIGFYDITDVVGQCMERVGFIASPTLDDIFESNGLALRTAGEILEAISKKR